MPWINKLISITARKLNYKIFAKFKCLFLKINKGAKPLWRVDVIKKIIAVILLVVAFNTVGWVKQDSSNHRMFDLNQEKELLLAQALAKLKKNRIILVGEHHSNKQHHQAQLSVIQALKDAGVSASDLDAVVLVGGATRMPMVPWSYVAS